MWGRGWQGRKQGLNVEAARPIWTLSHLSRCGITGACMRVDDGVGGGFTICFGAKVTRMDEVGGRIEGGIKDHS